MERFHFAQLHSAVSDPLTFAAPRGGSSSGHAGRTHRFPTALISQQTSTGRASAHVFSEHKQSGKSLTRYESVPVFTLCVFCAPVGPWIHTHKTHTHTLGET